MYTINNRLNQTAGIYSSKKLISEKFLLKSLMYNQSIWRK